MRTIKIASVMCVPINGGSYKYTFVSSTLTGSLTDIWVEIVTGHTFHKKIKK
jgi:hypothetical protein